jgi:hypothetical protein
VNVIVGPGDGSGDGGGADVDGAGDGDGAGAVAVSVAVTVLVTVPGAVGVTGAVAVAAGEAVNDETSPGETAGGGGAVLAGTLADGGIVRAVVRADVNGSALVLAVAYGGIAVRADAVPAAGLSTVGCGAGAGLGVALTTMARPATISVMRPVSAMVIVAATMTTAQHASSTYQASWYQGVSRWTIRGSLPSRRQPFLFDYEMVDNGQQPS